ncbi:hypothetical protein SAMN05216582_11281 [Selenomonas ruminantium]|uniref:Uncharacterized protein n=1 Tax=Selenomonas ruminantium TaxID=971 RepID=A0A1M6UHS7_SELRU|nr:hypothetical protein [Selenomonas ruminantium]SHK68805.1 hypothetical protein SAMN05216582_11281 [Selenomonas ruminantium]
MHDFVTASALFVCLSAYRLCTIDEVIGLFTSAKGEELFGKEGAASMAEHAKEVKAQGSKYCDCPACAPGKELMDAEADTDC